MTLDSPPGITRPATSASSSGRRTARASAPSARRMAMCSRKSPWSASTPIGPGTAESFVAVLPATLGETVRCGKVGNVDSDHRLAEAAGGLCDYGRVVVERGRLHDGRCTLGRVSRLEDAGADEDTVC